MIVLLKIESPSFRRCVGCGESIRKCEKMIVAVNMDTEQHVRGERYCRHCEDIAQINNEVEHPTFTSLADARMAGSDTDGERGLREREAYAAYQAAGCTSEYWRDRDAGYIG